MRIIKIIVDGPAGGFDIEENGRVCDGLGWDEMLGQLAAMTIPKEIVRPEGRYAMRTHQEWKVWRLRQDFRASCSSL